MTGTMKSFIVFTPLHSLCQRRDFAWSVGLDPGHGTVVGALNGSDSVIKVKDQLGPPTSMVMVLWAWTRSRATFCQTIMTTPLLEARR